MKKKEGGGANKALRNRFLKRWRENISDTCQNINVSIKIKEI